MRYVIAENSVISEIIDEFAIIRTSHEIMEFNDREEAILYFEENNIDYSILNNN
jgi:hypothetical protein